MVQKPCFSSKTKIWRSEILSISLFFKAEVNSLFLYSSLQLPWKYSCTVHYFSLYTLGVGQCPMDIPSEGWISTPRPGMISMPWSRCPRLVVLYNRLYLLYTWIISGASLISVLCSKHLQPLDGWIWWLERWQGGWGWWSSGKLSCVDHGSLYNAILIKRVLRLSNF